MERHLRIIAMATLVLVLVSAGAAAGRAAGDPAVYPGAEVTFADTACTMNFVFKGSDGRHYVGSAGHCPLADVEGTHVWKKGEGIAAKDTAGVPIGEFAFAAFDIEADLDFSLIRLDAGIQPQAQVAHWGGPTRINQEITYEPQLLKMFGSGLVVEDAVPQRQLVAPNGLDGEEDLYVTGVATPGDSGAPALTDSGEALGVVVSLSPTLRIPEQGPPYVGVVRIARLPFNLAIAEKLLGIDLKIERAPVL